MKYDVDSIITAMLNKGYTVFTSDTILFNLNIVAIRNTDTISNKFNDTLYAFYKYMGAWYHKSFNITVDPGTVYRVKPVNDAGTAIILPGQYTGMWKLGLHKGKYPALIQNKPCTVIRDNNKDALLDMEIPANSMIRTSTHGGITTNDYIQDGNVVFSTQTGMFGINCHKSGKGITEDVNYYSAGCVVFEDNTLFEHNFLKDCNSSAVLIGDSFTFTLLNDKDVRGI